MMRYFLFILLTMLSFPALAKETVDTDTDSLVEEILKLKQPDDYISPQYDFAKEAVKQFEEFTTSPGWSVELFEPLASDLVDILVGRQDYIAAGIVLEKAFNILLNEYSTEKIVNHNAHYLMTSAAEYYVRGGVYASAANFLETATSFCLMTGRNSGNHWVRILFNTSQLFSIYGNFDYAIKFFNDGMKYFSEIKESELSPITINTMLRCALALVDHTEQDTFSNMISFMKGDHSFTAENAMHWNLFIARCLHHYNKDYEAADRAYDTVFNSSQAKGAYPIAMTDAIETSWYLGKDKYSTMLLTATNIGRSLIEQSLNSFAINDTEQYWNNTAEKLNRAYGFTFNLENPDQFLMTGAFLNAVFTKSLSIQTYTEMMKSIKTGGSSKHREAFDKIVELRRKMGNTTNPEQRNAMASELNHLEWSLRISSDFTGFYGLNHNKTVLMPSGLAPDECEIEIVEYPKIENGEEINCYGAIICTSKPHTDKRLGISHRVENYEFVYLGPVIAWQLFHFGMNDNFDDKTRAEQYRHDRIVSVGNLMVPLLNHIQEYKKAYVSPTGILSMINIGALPWGTGDSIVNDKVEIVRINAAYDVPDIKKRDASLRSAALFHNIDFNNSNQSNNYMTDNLGETSGYRVSIEKGGPLKKFNRLPIDGAKLLQCVKSQTRKIDNHSAAFASEEAFKKYDSNAPELIHIDTHGFFIPSSDQAFIGKHVLSGTRERALLTCGLAMSGCNHAWAGEDVPEGKEDGILTGWEISCMDLSGCKLAVLSACETAQGDVDRINGVLGLQRALKMAGVKAMLLTLWSVDNELTEEFINGFYKRLPNSANFNEAFVETQKEFRKRHPDPYHWAPFMLIN